jgi:segregation and condensation protein B
MTDLSIEQKIEALLLYRGGAVRLQELSRALDTELEVIEGGLRELERALEGRGLALVYGHGTVALSTATHAAPYIEALRREELEGPVGKAGLETLAIIIYRGSATRADIEYIRGVNATAALRTLMLRGLIERTENPADKRSFIYRGTAELPAYFGITRVEELPGYQEMIQELQVVLNSDTAQ